VHYPRVATERVLSLMFCREGKREREREGVLRSCARMFLHNYSKVVMMMMMMLLWKLLEDKGARTPQKA